MRHAMNAFVSAAVIVAVSGLAFASTRLQAGPHHHRTDSSSPWISFEVTGGGASFMWGSPEREYVFVPTDPNDAFQGYYKTTNGQGETVGAIYFTESVPATTPPSGTYTATGVAGQGGDWKRG